MTSFEAWAAGGTPLSVALADGPRRIACHAFADAGPHVTLLHGFPTSSHDWAGVVERLGPDAALLTFDFLGFGDSDKPADHTYAIAEQADITEAVWAHHRVTDTLVVAHDYAVSVAQELLARRAAGALGVRVRGVVFLNGGLYPQLHRPQPAQVMLLDPELGPRLGDRITAETFAAGLRPTFSPGHQPSDADLRELWAGVARHDGHRIGHRLIRYIPDRLAHEARWVGALETTDVPRRFVWGMLDPVSGAHMAARIRERLPACPFEALDAVGHWPALEATDVVVAAIRAAAAS